MGTQGNPEAELGSGVRSYALQPESCLLRYNPIQKNTRKTYGSGAVTPSLLFGIIAFSYIAVFAGLGGGEEEGYASWSPYCGEKDHHLPCVKSVGLSFGCHPAAGWPWPSECLSEESLGGVGRLLLLCCDLGYWGGDR